MSGTKLRILALVHRHLMPPETIPEGTDLESAPWRTEYNVATTLRAMGHEVQMLAVHDDLGDIRRAAKEWKPRSPSTSWKGSRCVHLRSRTSEPPRAPQVAYRLQFAWAALARDKALSKKLLGTTGSRAGIRGVRIGRPPSVQSVCRFR